MSLENTNCQLILRNGWNGFTRYTVWSQKSLLRFLTPGCTAGGALLSLFPSQGERSNGEQHQTPGRSDSGFGTCAPRWPARRLNLKRPLTPASVSSPSQKQLGLDHLEDILSTERSRDGFLVQVGPIKISWGQLPSPPGFLWLDGYPSYQCRQTQAC